MNSKSLGCLLFLLTMVPPVKAGAILPDKVACVVPDRQDMQAPDRIRLSGWVGQRIGASEANRLAKLDTERLLEGYIHRPGRQAWEGEHVGKWLHAATLAWVNTGDQALRAKLDGVVAQLEKSQLEDGYLGTYLPKDRWTEWDVWSHKYNLIGLITYMRYTGNLEPLGTCWRMADLLCRTFGDQPGQRDILQAGWHVGMAPTSVLEPMVLLYRFTGEPRYLDFCRYLLRAWEQPNGPKVVSTLLTAKRVDKVGNGKAYEMLSCLNGALELYRTTGDRELLDACLNAWQDIRDNRLYLTGTASYRERFRDNYDLPNASDVGETCVTVTWIQFNAQLLRLTGEARFAEELERAVLNQLLGAQSPDCAAWGYYVQLQGRKPYSATLTGHCCLSSGPRAVALIPTFALSTDADGVVVNLYDAGTARLTLRDGSAASLTVDTAYPASGQVRIVVTPDAEKTFAVKLRIPAWCPDAAIRVNGVPQPLIAGADGYASLQRTWKVGDVVELGLRLEPRLQLGDHVNAGKVAFLYGPLVLAVDAALLPDDVKSPAVVVIPAADLKILGFAAEPAPEKVKTWSGAQAFRIKAGARQTVGGKTTIVPREIRLVPFADAGGFGSRYQVWVPLAGTADGNVLEEGVGATSGRSDRPDNSRLINDGETDSIATSECDGPATPQWFEVRLARPVALRRVTFVHGLSLRAGGWFDTSAGKPAVQIQREADGAWVTMGELADYPATTAADGTALQKSQMPPWDATSADVDRINRNQTFTRRFPAPERAIALRVVGMPSRNAESKSFVVTCAELQAFAD